MNIVISEDINSKFFLRRTAHLIKKNKFQGLFININNSFFNLNNLISLSKIKFNNKLLVIVKINQLITLEEIKFLADYFNHIKDIDFIITSEYDINTKRFVPYLNFPIAYNTLKNLNKDDYLFCDTGSLYKQNRASKLLLDDTKRDIGDITANIRESKKQITLIKSSKKLII